MQLFCINDMNQLFLGLYPTGRSMDTLLAKKWHQDKYLAILRNQGARITPLVTTVLKHLYESGTIHSPQELKDCVNRELSGDIGFPTIYRILDRLIQAGLVYRMHRNDNHTYYFLCHHPQYQHHHHFICTNCSKVQEIEFCVIKPIEKHVMDKLGATVTDHIIQLEGICSHCKTEKTS